jgi:TNF receptor-associated factor 4
MPSGLCNVHFTTTMPDRRLQRTLNGLQVYCCHKEAGCKWVGELGGLPQHLNIINFREGDRLIGCQLVDIGCMFCGEDIQRKDLKEHEEDICPERPYSCEYCKEYESSHCDVIFNHWPECPFRPVPCPNGCGTPPN